jgi:hypothetical protein
VSIGGFFADFTGSSNITVVPVSRTSDVVFAWFRYVESVEKTQGIKSSKRQLVLQIKGLCEQHSPFSIFYVGLPAPKT